jgi:hypothetical protein
MDGKDISLMPTVVRGEAGVRDGGDKPIHMESGNGQHYDNGAPVKNSGQSTRKDSAADASYAPHAPKRG